MLDVIKASDEAPRDAIDGRHGRHFESVPGYHQLHMVSQIVEDALCRVRIADIKEQASPPPTATMLGAAEASASERGGLLPTYTLGLVAVKSNLALFETGRRPSFVRSWF